MRSVEEGHYARKQLGSRSSIFAGAMPPDFSKGSCLSESRPTEKLLDYGCGDGTFLSLMSDKFKACVGADIEPEQVDDCRRRFATVPNVTFCLVQELNGAEHTRSVWCRHLHGDAGALHRLNGRQCFGGPQSSVHARWNSRHQRTHRNRPCLRAQVFSTEACRVARAERVHTLRDVHLARYGPDAVCDRTDGSSSAGLRRSAVALPLTLRLQLATAPRACRRRIGIERMLFTPMGLSRGWFSSQVWFVCRPR